MNRLATWTCAAALFLLPNLAFTAQSSGQNSGRQKAIADLKEVANAGNVSAQVQLGVIYLTGDGRVILQGRALSDAERKTLSLPADGAMISVDRATIRAIKEML